MSTTTFQIKTKIFEGPLELLLDLIEKKKLHISDVSLASVADDYIAHVEELDSFPSSEAAHFVLIASTLLLIKSHSLLPMLELSPEEQEDVDDLERRLKLHKRHKELARHIDKLFGENKMYATSGTASYDPMFTPDKSITKQNLLESVQKMIHSFPKPNDLSKVIVDKVMSLDDMITHMTKRVQKAMNIKFSEAVEKGENDKENKMNIAVSFLAMLELVKQGVVMVQQDKLFSDIDIESQNVTTPDYS